MESPYKDSWPDVCVCHFYFIKIYPYQDWLPTEAKQGWAWSVPGWETSWEN